MFINYDDDLNPTYEGTQGEDDYYAYQDYLTYLHNEETDINQSTTDFNTSAEAKDSEIADFSRFASLIWGKHPNLKSQVFILKRLVCSDNYNDGQGNQQLHMPLVIPEIAQYFQDNASTHDFSVSPAIYNDAVRSYSNICGLYCFWAEFDWGSVGHKKHDLPFASKDECIKTLKNNYLAADLKPNIIMNSGHGVHCYWLVDNNILGQQTKKQVEQVNEWLFQIGIGINRNYYNEVKNITSLMRSPYPAVNRKISSSPAKTKMIFTNKKICNVKKLRNSIVTFIIHKKRTENLVLKKSTVKNNNEKQEVSRLGDVLMVEQDGPFMDWLMDCTDLSYYKSDKYGFDSTSAKEAWIFKYLYLCKLDVPEIYEFCDQYMDRQYHIFRTRKTISDRLKRIQYEIDLALKNSTFPKKVKYEHYNEGDLRHGKQ